MRLAELTTEQLALLLSGRRLVVLVPVGSVEPHGPHLPLDTDTVISEAAAERAAARLWSEDRAALVAPAIGYGVTEFAAGFAGAISIPPAVLTAFVAAVARAFLAGGATHVCLVNNHLEPEHDAAIRAAAAAADPEAKQCVSVACPLARRWARTLSPEFKSGACHAGRYETSLVLAAAPERIDLERVRGLPARDVSLSDGIRQGKTTFRQMGLDEAYTGAPAEATADEGEELLERLATMIVTEVEEALGSASSATQS